MPKKYMLQDTNVVEIAFATIPAVPKATIAVTKSLDGVEPELTRSVTFAKTDAVKKEVYGYVLVPDEFDLQGHALTKEEVTKACHSFMKNLAQKAARGDGVSGNHTDFEKIGYPIESAIDVDGSLAKAAGVPADKCLSGAWWYGAKCSDDTWAKIEKGDYTGFSIAGNAKPIAVDDDPSDTSELGKAVNALTTGLNSVVTAIGKALGISKADSDPMTYNEAKVERKNTEKLWDIEDALWKSVRSIIESDATNKTELIGQTIDQFKIDMVAFVAALTATETTKALAVTKAILEDVNRRIVNKTDPDPQGGNQDMDEKLAKELTGAIAELKKTIHDELIPAIATAKEAPKPAPNDVKKTDVPPQPDKVAELTKKLDDATTELQALKKEVETLSKTPNPANGNSDDDPKPVNKAERPLAGTPFDFGGGGPRIAS